MKFNMGIASKTLNKMRGERAHKVEIANAVAVGDELAKVTLRLNAVPKTTQEVAGLVPVIAEATGGKMSMIQGTFQVQEVASASKICTATVFLRKNSVTRVIGDADIELSSVEGYVEKASNILMDKKDNSLWKASEVGGKKVICLQNNEDVGSMLEFAGVEEANIGVADNLTPIGDGNKGAYVMFVNPETASVDFGVVVGEQHVFSSETESLVHNVGAELVLASCNAEDHKLIHGAGGGINNTESASAHQELSSVENEELIEMVKASYESETESYVQLDEHMSACYL